MRRALDAARQTNDLATIMYCVDTAMILPAQQIAERRMIARADLEIMARVLGVVDRWREILNSPRTPRDKSTYLAMVQFLQGQLGGESYLSKWTEGQSLSMERAIDDAIRLLGTYDRPAKSEKRPPETGKMAVRLSERERQVLGLVAEGLSSQEIAKRLFITERTVRFHITSLFNQLGVNNRAQAVAAAHRLDLL